MKALLAIAIVSIVPSGAEAQAFRFPSTCWDGCMTVTAYYDYGGRRDWSCGSQTYSGHRGTDFAPYGSFTAMDEGRDIVAAAPGQVIAAHDGEFDRCTSGGCAGGGGFGNYVSIQHADGKVTYYAHMKRGTVAVGVGAMVSCGQRLGQIGSSGYSTGPHLHFEPRVSGSADDPFGGVSGCSGPESWWVEQRAYRTLPAESCETTAPPPMDGAAVDAIEPASGTGYAGGETFTARVTMRNTGNTTWSDAESILLAVDGGDPMGSPDQIRLGDVTIAPDATHTFELTLTAPIAPGDHVARFRMDRHGTARFGDAAEIQITVAPPPEQPDAGPTSPDAGVITPLADAGPLASDGSVVPPPDGRPTRDSAALTGGCSTTGDPAAHLFWLLLPLLLAARSRARVE